MPAHAPGWCSAATKWGKIEFNHSPASARTESTPVKLQADIADGVNLIRAHDAGHIVVNADTFTHSIIVPPTGPVLPWAPKKLEDLSLADFEQLAQARPELVIFGSGKTLRFPPPALMRPLMAARIGLETMDTAAACRTYNILVAEGRQVFAALILG